MAQITSKFLTVFFVSWIGGGLVMQIPAIGEVVNNDLISVGVYSFIAVLSALLWAAKMVLNLYEKKREIDEKYKDKDKL